MALYYSKDKFYDINSLELIYFYISSYLMFNKQGFCFHPNYNITTNLNKAGKLTIQISEKDNFIDLFKDEQVIIKIICGQNGVGKTSLLKIMAIPNYIDNKCIYVFKDKNNNFVASEKITIEKDNQVIEVDTIDYSFDGNCGHFCVTHNNKTIEDFQFEKNITIYYKETPKLYDGILDGSLITGFNISIWNLENKLDLLYNHNTRKELFNTESSIFSFKKFSSNVFLLYLLVQLEVSYNERVLDSFVEKWYEYDENKKLSFIDYIEEAIPNIDQDKYDIILRKQIKLFENDYLLEKISNAEADIKDLYNSIKDFLFLIFGESEASLPYNEFRDLLYFKGFNRNHGNKQFIESNYLSSGEYWSIRYRYEILHSIIQHDGCWWFECKKNGFVKYVGRPDFDHFVPKSKNPSLAMSCTNLVPSCQTCNEKIKRDRKFSKNTNLHPYFDNFDSIKYFDINLLKSNYCDKENFNIIFRTRKNANKNDVIRAEKNIKDFLLLEHYQNHKNEVVFLLKRISRYSNIKKLSSLYNLVNNNSCLIKDSFPERFCEINETSLGKLKRDILEKYVV